MGDYIVSGDNGDRITTANPFPIVAITSSAIPYRRLASADTNLVVPKGSAAKLYSLNIANVSAGTKYIKIYNKATNPVLASDTPVVTIPVTANGSVNHTFAGNIGMTLSNGLAIAITGGIADTDTTALVLNDVMLTLVYS